MIRLIPALGFSLLSLIMIACQSSPIEDSSSLGSVHQQPWSSYTIKSGDTLSGIATDKGTTVNKLRAANPGINADYLGIGQVINIPE